MRTTQIILLAVTFSLLFPARAVPLEWLSWFSAPKVALTFDDGPHPKPTALLMEVLRRHQAPATFFVVGRVAVRYPEVLRALAASGHEISNHTWNHPDVRSISTSAFRHELDQTRLLIQAVTGQRTFLFRTPGGTDTYLRNSFRVPSGYQLVLWDVHSLDQEKISAERIAERVISQVKDGDVVLMHNGFESTRDALEIIIPALKQRGFQFVTVTDLLRQRSSSEASARRTAFLQG